MEASVCGCWTCKFQRYRSLQPDSLPASRLPFGGLLLSQLHVPHAVESKPGCVPVIKILPKRTLNVGHSLEWFVRQNKEVGLEFMSVSIFFFLNPEIFLFEICVSKKVKKTGR